MPLSADFFTSWAAVAVDIDVDMMGLEYKNVYAYHIKCFNLNILTCLN